MTAPETATIAAALPVERPLPGLSRGPGTARTAIRVVRVLMNVALNLLDRALAGSPPAVCCEEDGCS